VLSTDTLNKTKKERKKRKDERELDNVGMYKEKNEAESWIDFI
jgi:hypothetical protein